MLKSVSIKLWLKEQIKEISTGLFLSLTFLPSLIIFLNGQLINYTSYGLPKLLLMLFFIFLLVISPFRYPKHRKHLILISFFTVSNVWFYFIGFTSLSLFFGIGSLIIWSSSCNDNFNAKRTLSLLFILFVILVPLVSKPLIQSFRNISMIAVDVLLSISNIEFDRFGTLYNIKQLNVEIWERCSGYSTSRVFLTIFSFIFLLQKRYLLSIFLAPLIAIGLGIFSNVLRIFIHLIMSIQQGEELSSTIHETIGITLFIVISIISCYFLLKNNYSLSIINKDFTTQTNRGKVLGDKPVSSCKVQDVQKLGVVSFVLISFLLSLTILTGRLNKKITHKYWTEFSLSLNIEHHNYFNEWAGGGEWILFEYPLQYCYQYFGWKEGVQTNSFYKNDNSVSIRTAYQIGEREFHNRYLAILYKIVRVDLFNEAIEVKITILESLYADNDLQLQ